VSAANSSSLRSDASVVIPIVAGIGNALMTVPMVRRIKRDLPQSRITVLARTSAMAEVFRRMPEVEKVVVTGTGVKGVIAMIRASRQRRPDVFLVPFPSNRWQYSLLAAASGAGRRILHGYPVGYFRAMHFLPAERVAAQRGLHDVTQNLRLLEPLGLSPTDPAAPEFHVSDDDRFRADELIRGAGLAPDARPIVIHAGSARTILAQAKRWPVDLYAKLIRELVEQLGDRVTVVEGPDEMGVADEIVSALGQDRHLARVVRLRGSLAETAALLERAELYVGSDSGLAHLAAAVGTPAVTIFAPADPDRVCPFGYRELVVQAPTACAPCFQYPWKTPYPKMLCREPLCIASVTVESVLAKVNLALQSAATIELTPQASPGQAT
jgi:ADP-heptose:LPS heptosyltransferase